MAASQSTSSSASTLDPAETRIVERWRRNFASMTGFGLTPEEQMRQKQQATHQSCEKWKSYLMNYSPGVVFMLKHLKLAGCDVKSENLPCISCDDPNKSGSFSPSVGAIVLCQENLFNRNHMEDVLVHELVHMYDHCKFKVDWNNLRHHACSEIRANSLSGDCKFTREFQRGYKAFSKQHQTCVRRRAILSVRANPACPDDAAAERAVNEVWESCFNDTRPFDEASFGSHVVSHHQWKPQLTRPKIQIY